MELKYNDKTNEFEDLTEVLMDYFDFILNGKFKEYINYGNKKKNESNQCFFHHLFKKYKWKQNRRNEQARKIVAFVNFFNLAQSAANGLPIPTLSDFEREDLFIYIAEGEFKRELRNLKAKAFSIKQLQILDIAIRFHNELMQDAIRVKTARDNSNKKIDDVLTKQLPTAEAKQESSGTPVIDLRKLEQVREARRNPEKAQNTKNTVKEFLKNLENNKGKTSTDDFGKILAAKVDINESLLEAALSKVSTTVALFNVGNALASGITIELTEVEKRGMINMAGHPNFDDIIGAVKESATSEYQQTVVQSTIQIAEELKPYAYEEEIATFEASRHLDNLTQTISKENQPDLGLER